MTDRGMVNTRLEAAIYLRLRAPTGEEREVEAVIDTGYTGTLTLPIEIAEAIGLERRSGGHAMLADGTIRTFDTFAAEVFWGGRWTSIVVSAVGGGALLGMSLIAGRGLWIEAVPDGAVEIRTLPGE